jgi:hypothetical protein
MNDGIKRIGNLFGPLSVGRGEKIDRNKSPDAPRTDADAQAPRQTVRDDASLDALTLNLGTARLIAGGHITDDIRAALEGFAPLGDMDGALVLCDIIERKGMETISWPNSMSLRQALETAAS